MISEWVSIGSVLILGLIILFTIWMVLGFREDHEQQMRRLDEREREHRSGNQT